MSCVLTSHPEFIELSKKLNLHPNFLESIVHKYQNSSKENVGKYPSVEYVLDSLKGTSMTNASEGQVKLWETKFSTPKIFNTETEANAYINEAAEYFSEESVIIEQDLEGNYKITVTEPNTSESSNIYYNILKQESSKEALLRTLAKEGLIHRYNSKDDYLLTTNSEVRQGTQEDINAINTRKSLIEVAYKKIQNRLQELGFPVNTITIQPTQNGGTATVIVNEDILNQIKDEISLGNKIKDTDEIYNIVNFLTETFGVEFGGLISAKKANEMTDKANPNAFIRNNKVYIVANRVSTDTIAEEFVHPFVNTLYKEEPKIFESLYKEASRLFPELHIRIWSSYRGRKKIKFTTEDLKQELVAQALSRHFREEWEKSLKEGKINTRKTLEKLEASEKFYTKAWNAIQRLLKTLYNKLYRNTFRLEVSDLKGMSLRQIAQLINASDSSFWINHEDKIRFNINESPEAQIQQSLDISQKLDNLLSSTKITASEVRDIANKVMYWLSDHITDLQTTPELATKIYGEQYKDVDFSKMSRMEIVKAIGVGNILTKAKQNFSPQQNNFNSRKLVAKARLIQENWEAIVYLASNTFGELESFNISYSDNSVIESVNNEEESYTQNTDNESIQEVGGNLQEHWQIESRTQSVITSMSKLVRQALQHCYILIESVNEEGTVEYTPLLDSWGIKERVPVKDAVNSILRWTQGSITLSDMKNKLREKSKDNPWITQILSRLDDMSGKEADFQSQFFTVFNKHFQSYDVVTLTDDKYITLPSNEFPALKEIVGNISALFKIGEHPLFRLNGINKELYKDFNIVYNELVELTKKDFSTLDVNDVAKKIAFLANILGFDTNSDFILSSINRGSLNSMMKSLYYINDALTANLDNPNYNPFDYNSVGSIIGNLRKFLIPLTDKLEDITAQTVYNDGKMYQSYVTPSYMTKLMQKFHLTGEAFTEFIENEFAKYEWFKRDTGDIETGWRNSWLRELVKDSNAREIFSHKVQLNFNRHNYMKNMSDVEYILSVLTEYFSQKPSSSRVPAWFRVPMLSNKPSSEFIRFYSERGSDYQDIITSRLKEVFNQELSRIQTVMQRNFDKGDPEFIKNFDKNGRRFCFLDFMNQYLDGESKNTELGKLLRDKLDGKEIDEVQLSSLVTEAIKEAMAVKVNSILNDWDNMGIFKAAEKISNIGTNIREALENFIWNDTLAAINIMELTITDPAYYKDAEDLQKRFAQIHSPGIRGNVEATDYDGNPVTDGTERTIYLTDFDDFKSNIIDNLTVVFDRKIATAPESERKALIALKESIIEQYQKINVADAQAYSSPHSYRKKAFIFGKWSKEAEQVYQRLLEGNYSYTDLQVAFQPLKPFKYSQIEKSSEVENSPMTSLKVPIQNKNSEYLLIMASAILQKEDTGRPNLLRAIYEVMVESAEKNPTKGIDTVQFTSAVKSGLMGEIDLTEFLEDENGEAKAKERIKASIYADGVSGEYDKICVHETSFEDYCIQQETPAHFKNHEQAHGSQIRYIIPSDLEEVDYEGNPVTYEVEGRKLTAQQFKDEYEATIAENIQESINNLIAELNLQGTKKERNAALRNILQKEILGNPRYGVELLQACELDANGEFRIPLGDPIQSKRIEQLINSIIKNRINKQTIAGGPVVQVSNFGTSKQLNIRFKDKKGELLQTRKEFEGTDAEYQNYIKENQAGIAYFECFAPAYTDTLFSNFMDADGNIDIKAIEALNPELLKMVGYRI